MATQNRKVVVTLDTYLSILAVVSSFCAIGITFYQAYLQRTQQYASVMPVLDNYKNNGGNDQMWHLEFIFVNNGVGPAFVQKSEITYKGKLYPTMRLAVRAAVNDEIKRRGGEPAGFDGYTVSQSGLYPTRVLPVGQEVRLCSIEDKYAARWTDEAIDRGDIRVKIWYKSIYGEQWLFDSTPAKIESRNTKLTD